MSRLASKKKRGRRAMAGKAEKRRRNGSKYLRPTTRPKPFCKAGGTLAPKHQKSGPARNPMTEKPMSSLGKSIEVGGAALFDFMWPSGKIGFREMKLQGNSKSICK